LGPQANKEQSFRKNHPGNTKGKKGKNGHRVGTTKGEAETGLWPHRKQNKPGSCRKKTVGRKKRASVEKSMRVATVLGETT